MTRPPAAVAATPRRALGRRRSSRHCAPGAAALDRSLLLGGLLVSLVIGGWPAFRAVRPVASSPATWNPVRRYGGAGADRRHPGDRRLCPGHRPADRLRRRVLPDRALPRRGCAGRSAPRSSCSPASPRSSTACGACSSSPRCSPRTSSCRCRPTPAAGSLLGDAGHRRRRTASASSAASIILAIMILPFMAAILRELSSTVPPPMRESAYGLGSTTWEVVCKVVPALRATRRHRRRSCWASAARSARPWR